MKNSIKISFAASILIALFFELAAFCQIIKEEIVIPPSPYPISNDAFSVSTIAEGFSIPYGIAIVNENEYFITDRIGKLFHFQDSKLTEVSGVPMVAILVHTGKAELVHGGLMDITLHPNYTTNSWVYFSYVSVDCFANVARCKIQNNAINGFEIIFATKNQNVFGNGMRIVWEDDTHFFLNVGGSAFSTKDHPILVSQDLNSEGGKIHRLMDDGRIPSDNPILNGFKSPTSIWTYGHRDVQGLYYDKGAKTLFGAEHGPKGGDEFNIIEKGKNYGWPLFSYGIHYDGVGVSIISKDSAAKFTTLPEHYWTVPSSDGGQSIGPACMLKVDGGNIPEWNDHFLIGSLSFRRLMKYNRATDKTFGLKIEGRIRTIKQLPSGDFIALIERSNLTDSNGKIIRIKK
ncbi:MAG: PQQ-dependent sugar dehydrogenase [Dyadobacter sp.]|uniref:PQQ-dependent sugar dehydrogenase n=1 Tax=Dyadobacter sp. TaxID=1914288 RepID=UPI003266E86B